MYYVEFQAPCDDVLWLHINSIKSYIKRSDWCLHFTASCTTGLFIQLVVQLVG